MNKRKSVGIEIRLQRHLVHQAENRKVSQKKAVEILLDELGSLAAQDGLTPPMVGFEFIKHILDGFVSDIY